MTTVAAFFLPVAILLLGVIFGLVKYPPPRVDNSWYSMEGCATIVLLYTYTESVEEKKYDEEGKEER